ncbi:MAG: HAD family hydrolase [Deltaproteobacteria bacterium]|nr:HAD family hydrolase [Deltaproteobacteria bacterium]
MTERLNGLRAILFDFGGTLDGPGVPWVERFAAAYHAAGLTVAPERLHEAVGFATRQAYHCPEAPSFDLRATVEFHVHCQFAYLQLGNAGAAEAIIERFVAQTAAALAHSRGLLARWQRRFTLGVVSNFYGNVARLLAEAGIVPLLAVMIDSTVAGVSKPDPRIFTLALDQLGLSAAAALYVGDSLQQDILPARAAGMRTAWLRGSQAVPEQLPADLCLDTLGELEQVLGA